MRNEAPEQMKCPSDAVEDSASAQGYRNTSQLQMFFSTYRTINNNPIKVVVFRPV